MFSKILIANRGEIVCRIVKTCKKLSVPTVAIYSEADRKARHVKMADEAYRVGNGDPSSVASYLNMEEILQIALAAGVDAIHPGYGFLSENPTFARRCQEFGITFIGPNADVMEKMGDKILARKLAKEAGLSLLPGTDDAVEDSHAIDRAWELGFPLMVKASEGGGGIGIHIIETMDQLLPLVERVRKVSLKAFGSSTLFFERYLQGASHIEVQLVGDQHGNLVHLYERDCSMQRRNQKVIEETPAVKINSKLRKNLCDLALKLGRYIGFTNAGTVEFLVSSQGKIYFLEMNTRLQVEHGVTEMVTGLDLVELQIQVAWGEKLPVTQSDIQVTGHAIEARIYPEDPETSMPDVGVVTGLYLPTGQHTRVDTALCKGYEVTLHYEPLLAKVMTWGNTRDEAMKRLDKALLAFRLEGVKSNILLQRRILSDEKFGQAAHHTGLLATLLEAWKKQQDDEVKNKEIAAAIGTAIAFTAQRSCQKDVTTNAWRLQARREGVGLS